MVPANSGTAAVTMSEVSGVPTLDAVIDSPPESWMEPAGPSEAATRRLMSLETDVLPVEDLRPVVRELLAMAHAWIIDARFASATSGNSTAGEMARQLASGPAD